MTICEALAAQTVKAYRQTAQACYLMLLSFLLPLPHPQGFPLQQITQTLHILCTALHTQEPLHMVFFDLLKIIKSVTVVTVVRTFNKHEVLLNGPMIS